MLVEGGKRYIRPSHVPHVDTKVEEKGAAGDVELSVRSPLDTRDRGDGLYAVYTAVRRRVLDVPHLKRNKTFKSVFFFFFSGNCLYENEDFAVKRSCAP